MKTRLWIIALCGAVGPLAAAQTPPAAARMSEPGADGKPLAREAGRWTVVTTLRPTPDGKPPVTEGLVAERAMVGPYLQETLEPAPGAKGPAWKRIDYLTCNRVEGRWQHVSLDTRFAVGSMPADSFAEDSANQQRWYAADGSGRSWVAAQYDYTRVR